MRFHVRKSFVSGNVRIPGSKSHTIRALFFAALSNGDCIIRNRLESDDTRSALNLIKVFGARTEETEGSVKVSGFGGKPAVPEDVVDVGNSGTTLRFGVSTAALCEGTTVFTGDYQIRRRPLDPLIRSLNHLGADVSSTRGNGMAPVVVRGRMKGGKTTLDSVSSQFLSSLLIHCPLLEQDTHIEITRLNEVPYIDMTLWWLKRLGIDAENRGYAGFDIKGGQGYRPFETSIPGDFSSATFFAVLAAISGGEFVLENLDMTDTQGDKAILSILGRMGAHMDSRNGDVMIKGCGLTGREIDMNATPDALPAMAVAACFAHGETRLVNVPQARFKETDRIRAMCEELGKMGADISELPDGLVVRESRLHGCDVSGRDDHRVVMALAIAGLNAAGETVIDTAEAASVTFPGFAEMLRACGADIEILD